MTPIDYETFRAFGINPSTDHESTPEENVDREEDVNESSAYSRDWPEMPLGVSRG